MSGTIQSGNIDSILSTSWNYYRDNMLECSGTGESRQCRPLADPDYQDRDRDGNRSERITVSEAAAYTMLRAVLMGSNGTNSSDPNREAFAAIWRWTAANLQRSNTSFQTWRWTDNVTRWEIAPPGTHHSLENRYRNPLFAWRWVPTLNGGVSPGGVINYTSLDREIDRSGYHAASDDIEIAIALYFAYQRGWGDEYLAAAEQITTAAWENYVVEVGSSYYFFGGDQFSWSGELNPSYFRPAFFRHVLPLIDPAHPWARVADSSYRVLEESGRLTLNGQSGEGVHLPPNWVRMTHHGRLTDSAVFAGPAGADFTLDAFRALFAAAQDYAWFSNSDARRYLTDCSAGPRCFLQGEIGRRGVNLNAYRHDGSPLNLPAEQRLAVQSGYLSFLYFAESGQPSGETFVNSPARTDAQRLYRQMMSTYDAAGFWGSGRDLNYYSQNWAWFSLLLINGHPNASSLLDQVRSLQPAPALPSREEGSDTELSLALFQIDPDLGRLTADRRPILEPRAVEDCLPLAQLTDVIFILANGRYTPSSDSPDRFTIFRRLNESDQNWSHHLLPFLADPREYWNNHITLLSVYANLLVQRGSLLDRQDALYALEEARFLADLEDPTFGPHEYNRALLDLTEAELRAQIGQGDEEFYRTGIDLAVSAINRLLDIDPRIAQPDYYFISKALQTIGDLYLRIYESNRNPYFLQLASDYYCHLINMDSSVNINDQENGLVLMYSPTTIQTALNFNRQQGYLSETEYQNSPLVLRHLRAVAEIKHAALIIQRQGDRPIGDILNELVNVNRAIEDLTAVETSLVAGGAAQPGDFYRAFAAAVKGDLLLLLADSVKYRLWPLAAEPGSNEALALEITRARGLMSELGASAQEFDQILNLLDDLRRAAGTEERISALFALNDHLLTLAQGRYQVVSQECPYLYAWAQTKIMEIGVRTTFFMDHEFRYLTPFYTSAALSPNPIPRSSFLGVSNSYLRAMLLASADETTEAEQLLRQVLTDLNELPANYQLYFEVHARLKLAELFARRTGGQSTAIAEFERIEQLLTGGALTSQQLTALRANPNDFIAALTLAPEIRQEMGWRPDSFLAEMYHEWANLTGNQQFGRIALEYCFRSDSRYDFETRRGFIVDRWSGLRARQAELAATYQRRVRDGR